MIDFPRKYAASEQDSYWVALWVTDTIDLYDYIAFNHIEALQLAFSDHKMAGRPLPAGTPYLVAGPCRDHGCDCGKTRTKTGFVLPETASGGLTN